MNIFADDGPCFTSLPGFIPVHYFWKLTDNNRAFVQHDRFMEEVCPLFELTIRFIIRDMARKKNCTNTIFRNPCYVEALFKIMTKKQLLLFVSRSHYNGKKEPDSLNMQTTLTPRSLAEQ